MENVERTRRVVEWQERLREYARERVPPLRLGRGAVRSLGAAGGSTRLEWTVSLANPFFIDANACVEFDLVDASGRPIEVSEHWIWSTEPECTVRYIRMDRDYRHLIHGNTSPDLRGFVSVPDEVAARVAGLLPRLARAEFDIRRFEPRFMPNLAVRSDLIEKNGRLYAIWGRENVFNEEYCTLAVTPVLHLLDGEGRELKAMRGKERRLGPRCGGTLQVYTRVSKQHAVEYGRHYVWCERARCIIGDGDRLVRAEARRSGFLPNGAGRGDYEQNSVVSNDGFEHVSAVLEYGLFRNTRTPVRPIGRAEVKVPPRSSVDVTRIIPAAEIGPERHPFIRVDVIDVKLGDFHPIPG